MKDRFQTELISRLTDRFMAGKTDQAEEQLLADYFRNAEDIPDEWQTYKYMFAYFDEGMPVMPAQKNRCPYRFRTWLAVAAAMLLPVLVVVSMFRVFVPSAADSPATVGECPSQPVAMTVGVRSTMPAPADACYASGSDAPSEALAAVPADCLSDEADDKSVGKNAGHARATADEEPDIPADVPPVLSYERQKAELAAAAEALRRTAANAMTESLYNSVMKERGDYILAEDMNGDYAIVEQSDVVVL